MDTKPLPFDQAKLDGISANTIAIHHDKLYAGYVAKSNEIYQPTPYQASARSWQPDETSWKTIRDRSVSAPAVVTILGERGTW